METFCRTGAVPLEQRAGANKDLTDPIRRQVVVVADDERGAVTRHVRRAGAAAVEGPQRLQGEVGRDLHLRRSLMHFVER